MDSALSFLKKAASEAASIGGKAASIVADRTVKLAGDVKKMADDLPSFEIDGVSWQAQKALGEGGFGTVYLCTDYRHREAAIKACVAPNDRVHEARREIDAMKACEGHPNCVQLLGYNQIRKSDVTEFLLATEFCSGGTLFDAIQKGSVSSENDIIRAFMQVCAAVAYLHSRDPPMIHRDLKLANVYFNTHSGKWCLGDFGSVQIGVKDVVRSEVALVQDEVDRLTTPQYRAPEQCNVLAGSTLGCKIDTWALGVMLYQMAYKKTPWDSTLGTMGGRYKLPPTPRYSENFQNLFAMMFKLKPEQRPTVSELIEHLAATWSMEKIPTPVEAAPAPAAAAASRRHSDPALGGPSVSVPTPPSPVASPAQHRRSGSTGSGSGSGAASVLSIQPVAAPVVAAAAAGTAARPVIPRTPTSAVPTPTAPTSKPSAGADLLDLLSFDGSAPAAKPAAPAAGAAAGGRPMQGMQGHPQGMGGMPQQGMGYGAPSAGGSAGIYSVLGGPTPQPPTQQMAGMHMSWGAAAGGFAPNYDALDDRPKGRPAGPPMMGGMGYGAPPPGYGAPAPGYGMGMAVAPPGYYGQPQQWSLGVQQPQGGFQQPPQQHPPQRK